MRGPETESLVYFIIIFAYPDGINGYSLILEKFCKLKEIEKYWLFLILCWVAT